MHPTTLVIGASTNPQRFSYKAIRSLVNHQIPVVAVGLKEGTVFGVPVQRPFPKLEDIDTITLYVGALNQKFYQDYMLHLKPRRVIFNPGSENPELEKLLLENHIEVVHDCTLVMLQTGSY